MAEPLRKPTADLATVPGDDPFRYGWRWRRRRLPSGEVVDQQIPLTAGDLLDPQLGDEVPQSQPHHKQTGVLYDLLDRHFASREDVLVACDLKMLWGIPGVPGPSPDIAVVPGVRKKYDSQRTSFDVALEGTRPCLVVEVVSSTDAETRRNDYEKKVKIYQRVGIPEYLILDPPTPSTDECLLLIGYRLGPEGRYRRIEPNRKGLLLSETTSLLFGVAEDGRTLRVVDAVTDETLLTSGEHASRESAARQAAEQRAARAEAELARLRAELERRGKP